MGRGAIAGFTCGLLLACGGTQFFACETDADCIDGEQQGTCEITNYCSFEDLECPSGRRYADLAGDGLAGLCVVGGDGGSSGLTTLATTGSSAPTSPTTTTIGVGEESSTGPPERLPTDESGEMVYTLTFGERDSADIQDVTSDTYVQDETPGNNGGAHTDFHVAQGGAVAVSLLKFDISGLPADASIRRAIVEVWTEGSGELPSGTVQVFELLEGWEEGEGDQEPGIANWGERQSDAKWTAEGVGDGSRGTVVLADFAADEESTAWRFDVPIDLVQRWADDASRNHGIALTATDQDTQAWFASREASDESTRPLLEVDYTL